MSITDSIEGDKGGADRGQETPSSSGFKGILKDWVLLGVIFLTGALCFGLGIMAGREEGKKGDSLWIEQLPKEETTPISITPSATTSSTNTHAETTPPPQPAAAAAALPSTTTGKYVAAKTGTKYYLPTCASAKRIKDENKVWFETKEAAQRAGYEPGSSCKGL